MPWLGTVNAGSLHRTPNFPGLNSGRRVGDRRILPWKSLSRWRGHRRCLDRSMASVSYHRRQRPRCASTIRSGSNTLVDPFSRGRSCFFVGLGHARGCFPGKHPILILDAFHNLRVELPRALPLFVSCSSIYSLLFLVSLLSALLSSAFKTFVQKVNERNQI